MSITEYKRRDLAKLGFIEPISIQLTPIKEINNQLQSDIIGLQKHIETQRTHIKELENKLTSYQHFYESLSLRCGVNHLKQITIFQCTANRRKNLCTVPCKERIKILRQLSE
jgi:predicted RNase H-like nuclease (RuvC/YqgF family)